MAKKKTAPSTATPPPAFAGTTHVCFILDKSGSMSVQRQGAIDGFNEFLGEQKKIVDDTRVTLLLFDAGFSTPIENVPLADAKEIGLRDYAPSGTTALFDAVGRGTAMLEPNVKDADRAVVVILTDGMENASSRIRSHEQIRDIIRMKEKAGNWTFTYMGSGENWQQEATAMGVAAGNMTAYNPADARGSVMTASLGTGQLRSSNVKMSARFYSGTPPQAAPLVQQPAYPIAPPLTAPAPRVATGNPFSAQSQRGVARDAMDSALDDLLVRAATK